MPKALKSIYFFLVFGITASAVVLRTSQLLYHTETETGYIKRGAENTIAAFYIICGVAVILCMAVLFSKFLKCNNLFEREKSRLLLVSGIAAGISMFYDFIHQCINIYEYITKTSYIEISYFISICVIGLSALICAFYFIAAGISFYTDRYDFKQFRYFHLAPVIWSIFGILIRLTRFEDEIYAEELFLQYSVLISAIVFYIMFIKSIDDERSLKAAGCTGFIYFCLSFIISVPRIAAFFLGIELFNVTFSSITFLFTGIFALTVSLNIFKSEKKD